MKPWIFILLTAFLFNCHPIGSNRKPLVEIKSEPLKKAIKEYIQVLSKEHNSKKVITVNFDNNRDTVSIQLINSYPDVDIVKVNGFADYSGFRLFFIGYYPVASFYDITSIQKTPIDLVKETKDSKRRKYLTNTEPLFWKLYFVGNRLVDCYPKQLMSMFSIDYKNEAHP